MNESQIHAGHRERMIDRFLNYPDSLNDHEILEILLYNFIPRVDTNPLAHRILRVFGSLNAVFTATEKELLTVRGVGPKVATGLMLIGNVFRRVDTQKKVEPRPKWITPELIFNNLRKIVNDFTTESFVMILLDEKYKELFYLEFEDKSKNSVTMDVPEVLSAFAVYKPTFVIVAHTHPSGNPNPSGLDDLTTKKLNVLCEIHNVNLLDHVILTKTDKFSYYTTKRMEYVKEIADIEKLLKKIEEN